MNIPTIEVVNPVGSGDSTVAGIASALLHHESDEDLLKSEHTWHAQCTRKANRTYQYRALRSIISTN